jgi:hypothetical protein
MKRFALWMTLLLLTLVAACSAPAEPTPTPVPPTPTPSPQDWLEGVVAAWNNLESFHFTLDLENRTLMLDDSGFLAAAEAEGDVVAPDRLQVATLVQTLLGSTQVQFVAIGEDQYLTNPLNGEWEQAPPELQTDVTGIFDPEVGIGALLADLQNLERLADEQVEGTQTVHLRGTLPGSALAAFAADLEGTDEVTIDLWAGTEDRRIRRIIITEPANAEGETPTWTFNFSNFDADVTIEPPL